MTLCHRQIFYWFVEFNILLRIAQITLQHPGTQGLGDVEFHAMDDVELAFHSTFKYINLVGLYHPYKLIYMPSLHEYNFSSQLIFESGVKIIHKVIKNVRLNLSSSMADLYNRILTSKGIR